MIGFSKKAAGRRKIAIVIPWFGRDLMAGAELHAWQLAVRLAARNNAVEVLTTCCRSHADDWSANHLPAGLTGEADDEGFAVRRFKVEPRMVERFEVANRRLLAVKRESLRPGVSPVNSEDEEVFCRELIRSPELLQHLAMNGSRYDAVILLPYLFGPILEGVHLVASKSLLQPCLHDEAYAYLPVVTRAFYAAKTLLFLSEGERQLANRLFGPGIISKSFLAGAGVDSPDVDLDDSLLLHTEKAPFILCLGRKDPGKNTDFLARCFLKYKREHPKSSLRLVIAGPGHVRLPQKCPGLIEFGVLTEAQKLSLLRNCAALFHPSENESYSRVIMEAWLQGRPAAANTNCLATATAISRGGGWLAGTENEWVELFGQVEKASPEELISIGDCGQRYAMEVASWDAVIGRYESAIDNLIHEETDSKLVFGEAGKTPIHQVLPNVAEGDAISNHALWLRGALRKLGHPSEIFALGIDPRLLKTVQTFKEGCVSPKDAIIYHHSIGSAVTPSVIAHPGPKCLIYHNITPHHFLEAYLPLHAQLCKQGREELPNLAVHFPVSVGDSTYNATELSEVGFHLPGVLPICVNPSKWQIVPDAALMARLQDGRTNILFVGRYSPNKRQEDLIFAFAKLKELDPSARLILVGSSTTANDFYVDCLRQICFDLGVEDAVELTGHVSDEQLAAYYRTAHLFWSMSEHEGFCVPLIEAMWFDVPVYAFSSTAVAETMGGAGRLFRSKKDLDALAMEARQLASEPMTRRSVIEGQRQRREAFLEGPVLERLEELVDRMLRVEGSSPESPAAEIDPASVRNIAVVKLDHIGDVLLASPAFESLKQRFPNARLTAVIAPHSIEILRNNPFVDECVPYDAPWFWRTVPSPEAATEILNRNAKSLERLSGHQFDIVVNLRSDMNNLFVAASLPHTFLLSYTNDSAYPFLITHALTRTRGMHICRQHHELLQVIGANSWSDPALYPTDRDRHAVTEIGPASPDTVAIFPGAGLQLKCWSPVKFRELVRRLRLAGIPVTLVGSDSDRKLAAEIIADSGALNLCGRFNLSELGVFLKGCTTLVTNDSAPMHIAAAVGIPVVYITRPNTLEEFAPIGLHHQRCCLAGCANPCDGFDAEKRLELADFCQCIQSISVDEVEAKVWDVFENAKPWKNPTNPEKLQSRLATIVAAARESLLQTAASVRKSASSSKPGK